MSVTFEAELKNDKFYYSKPVITIIIGIVIGIITYQTLNQQDLSYVLYLISIIIFSVGILLLFEKRSIKYDGHNLIIENSVLGFSKFKYFDVKRIQNLTYRKNVKSNVYRSKGEIRVMGFDTTPESWKEYYYHKEVISFNYQGKKIEIGKWKKPFNGEQLVNQLNNKIN